MAVGFAFGAGYDKDSGSENPVGVLEITGHFLTDSSGKIGLGLRYMETLIKNREVSRTKSIGLTKTDIALQYACPLFGFYTVRTDSYAGLGLRMKTRQAYTVDLGPLGERGVKEATDRQGFVSLGMALSKSLTPVLELVVTPEIKWVGFNQWRQEFLISGGVIVVF
jgi:hypothetical protein